MKYKVGDKVKIVYDGWGKPFEKGAIGIVRQVEPNKIWLYSKNKQVKSGWMRPNQIELENNLYEIY